MLKGFKEFILRGNVIDLAVAVVIGAAFGAVVASFVADLLTPLIAALVRVPSFADLTFSVRGSTFHYGRFLNSLISFLLVALAVYAFVVRPIQALQARRKRAEAAAPAVPEEVRLLAEIRDLLSARDSGIVRQAPGEPGAAGGQRTG